MSGIFAFTGSVPCRDVLLNGLVSLGRRGGELCGTAIRGENGINIFKIHGSPEALTSKAESIKNEGYTGLSECNNSERAKPSAITSVPCASEKIAVAVDGDIENFDELRRRLKVAFPIATNEDLMLALLTLNDGDTPLKRLDTVMDCVSGNPTVVFITSDEEAVYCRAGDAPLEIGIFDSGCAVASELQALSDGAKRYFTLESGEFARITKERAAAYDERLKRIKKPLLPMPDIKIFENDFPLEDEVYCLPVGIKDTLGALIKNGGLTLCGFDPTKRAVEKFSRIIITGSGSSFRAALLGQTGIEQLCDVPCSAFPSGELRYSPAVFNRSTLLIAVSCRGENESTVACVKRAQSFGAKTVAVTSAPYSYLARLCDRTINVNTDFTSGDVCLRSFISSALALNLIALKLGYISGIISDIYLNVSLKIAEMLPGKVSSAIKASAALDALADIFEGSEKIIFSGLCADYALSVEAAKKLRDITNFNALSLNLAEAENESEGFIKSSNVIAIITNRELLPKALRILRRLRARGAAVTIITSANIEEEISDFEGVISFSDSIPLFNWVSAAACIYKAAVNAAPESKDAQEQRAV